MLWKVRSYTWFNIRLITGAITLIVLAAAFFAPKRHVLIHPAPHTVLNLYDDREQATGKTESRWLDRSVFGYVCTVKEGAPYKVCGVSAKFYKKPMANRVSDGNPDSYDLVTTRDISGFEALIFDFDYTGEAKKLRYFARGALNGSGSSEDIRQQKLSYAYVYPEEFKRPRPVRIKFDEFSVADWWMDEFEIRRRHAKPTFDDVIEIAFDLPPDAPVGEHYFVLRKIIAVGDWFPKELLYWGVIALWLALLGLEAVSQHYKMAYKNRVYRASLDMLEANNQSLMDEANRDLLTGAYNRRGIEQVVNIIYDTRSAVGITLLIMDIDKFKNINDTYGHAFGDKVLAEFSGVIDSLMRSSDKFGRWGGEEFVVIAQQNSREDAVNFANTLREAIEGHEFILEGGQIVPITVSIGLSKIKHDQPFAVTFERADEALYCAKKNGRNCVRYG